MLETKRLLEYAGNQRESCRRQVEILKKELEQVTNVAETKTKECIVLVGERDCLARELKKLESFREKLVFSSRVAEIDNRQLRSRVIT